MYKSNLFSPFIIVLFCISNMYALNPNATYNGQPVTNKMKEKPIIIENTKKVVPQTPQKTQKDMTFTTRPYKESGRAIDKWKLHNN